MTAKLPISVIVISYYTGESLFPMLHSLLTEPVSEIIIINNGNEASVIAQLEALSEADSRVRLFHQANIGFAKACNFAAQQINNPNQTLLFLNPDMLVSANAITILYDKLKEYYSLKTTKHDVMFTGFVRDKNGQEQRGLRRNLLTPLSLAIEMSGIDKVFTKLADKRFNLTQQKINTELVEVPVISGCCMMLTKAFFEQLQGLDEGYFLHVEDVDFCRRIQQQQGKIYLCVNAIFLHYQGTSQADNSFVAKHKKNGFIRYFKKFHPIIWYSPIGWGLLFFIYLKYWLSFIK